MIKSEFVGRIATQNPHHYQRDLEKAVHAILALRYFRECSTFKALVFVHKKPGR